MIDAQQAVRSAYNYLIEMAGIQGADRIPKDVTLEEVEAAPTKDMWFVTLSYSTPGNTDVEADSASEPLRHFLNQPSRKFRVVTIDGVGGFISLKIPSS